MTFKGNDKGDEPQPTQTAKTDKDVLHQEAGLITSEDDAKNYEKSEGKSFTTDYKRTILLILLIVGIIIVLALILKKDKNKNDETGENVEPTATTTPVRYDSNIIVGKDDVASDEVGNVEDGQMNLEMKDVAISKDGK